MNDIGELKRFVGVHARAQGIDSLAPRVLKRIRHDGDGDPGSWVGEWSDEAERLAEQGRLLDASRLFTMARFPYVDGPARQKALDGAVAAFDSWRLQTGGIDELRVELPEGGVRCWTTGLSTTDRKPLLLFMGGIVSTKEQWAPALTAIGRLGLAGVVAELPGVGENTLPYTPESHRMISAVIDAVADRADTDQTYALALSFSGHLALRCAGEDPRIRGIVTAGAPVHHFFTDREWLSRVPDVTLDTLSHLTGISRPTLPDRLPEWAIPAQRLGEVTVPVAYSASLRDEIIPRSDLLHLRRHLARLSVVQNDDVHGSPRHVAETRLWSISSVLRMHGGRLPQRAAIALALAAAGLRRRITNRG
ncbi:alpha/beta hydrolase [Nocardiopsis exhalans]|uniref:Alpha/beta hydrolase n=1 Tax=Nocardiopsis exhalans TaxID=163604 RepID=A0ABY5D274_9ACTN|nr:alpha/beta hydrolase [Nocardiopsis exhalans]USY18419.1 alpha/beta hydrolase [Nocardiopsis exhalans]